MGTTLFSVRNNWQTVRVGYVRTIWQHKVYNICLFVSLEEFALVCVCVCVGGGGGIFCYFDHFTKSCLKIKSQCVNYIELKLMYGK